MRKLLLSSACAFALMVGAAEAGPLAAAVAATASSIFSAGGVAGAVFSLGSLTLKGIGAVAAQFAVRAALGYALNALTSRPQTVSRGYATNVNQIGPGLPHQIIYGETSVGGAVFYQATSSSNGSRQDRLHRCIAFAGHEIDSYQKIFLDDIEVTLDGSGNVTAPSQFVGKVRIKQYLGTDDQTADPDLVSEVGEWTSECRARGIAYLYVRFQDAASFQQGIPNVSAVIRGKKVADPRFLIESGTPTATYAQDDLIPSASYSDLSDLFWEVDLEIPANPSGTIFEIGATPRGVYLGFTEGKLTYLAGSSSGLARLDIDPTPILGKTVRLSGGVNISTQDIEIYYSNLTDDKSSFLGRVSFPVTTTSWRTAGNGALGRVQINSVGDFTESYNGNILEGRFYDSTTIAAQAIATQWSNNPALCIRDYVLSEYGLNDSVDSIEDSLFSNAAISCDEVVLGAPKYTCNGSLLLDSSPEDIIRSMLSSMGGIFWNYSGKWAIQAAEYRPPLLSLDENDLRSSLQIATRHSRRDNFNTVVGQYKGEETNYQPDNFTEVTSGFWIEEDNNKVHTTELNLLFTDTDIMSQRIARTFLRRNRRQITVSGSFGLRAMDLKVGDNVMLSVDHMGWTNKVFEVVDWRLGVNELEIQVSMILREMEASVFEGIVDTLDDESGNNLQDESGNILEAIVA